MRIEPYDPRHLDAVIRLSLRAWAPVFVSIESAMDPDVFRAFYPDWRVAQQQAVEEVCADPNVRVWVAVEFTAAVGFVAAKLHAGSPMGEVYMIAVDPEYQRRGIAGALMDVALEWIQAAGMSVAMVETGGDPGHAPARSAYEKMGFRLLPVARYFKKL